MADHDRRPRQHHRQPRPHAYVSDLTIKPVGPTPRSQKPSTSQPKHQSQHHLDEKPHQDDDEFEDQKEALLERLHSFHAPYEGLDLLFSPFDSYSFRPVRVTYRDGIRLAEVRNDPAVIKPRVGITFLAGADTPQVNQMEEISMTQTIPDQKTPAWRVITAGALLTNFTFSKAMTIEHTSITPSIVQAYRDRHSAESQFAYPNSPSRAITIRRKPDRLLTIDSENVQIVNDLSKERWDLEAVLIEVDQSSLIALISNYQGLIRRCGPDLSLAETIQLLDTMIEDARRLCIRSPSLFRMSTRRLIVASKNTRYGVDDSTMFKTLITSSGIKHILSLSAAYFNSLPQSAMPGTEQEQRIQSEVRPRFLQMVVLLLALLNDDDLAQLEEFLQVTYGIKADRQHLELLILKVLPLSSINSKIFLHSLVKAVGGQLVKPSPHIVDQRQIWNLFITNLLENGYILPGNIHEVGGHGHSWVVNWPEDGGLKDTSIFRYLQYAGHSRTINEIPRVDLNSEIALGAELTVKLANGGQYIVASSDLESIVRMTPGRYSVSEAVSGGRSFDLDISDTWVNQPFFRAIGDVNSMLSLVKSIMPHRSQAVERFKRVFSPGGHRYDESNLSEVRGCGRLTYHVARLNGQYISITYKIDGRGIGRRELLRLFQGDQNKIEAVQRGVQATLAALYEGKRTKPQVSQTIFRLQEEHSQIQAHIADADRRKQVMLGYPSTLLNEPVTKILYQVGARNTQISNWRDYKAWHRAKDNVLCVESERRVVQQCSWQEDTISVTLHDVGMRYFVTPLASVTDALKHEQLKEGDTVLLCGHYLLVVEPTDETFAPNGTGPDRVVTRSNLRTPHPLRPTSERTRPEQELHFHNGLPELEARERGAAHHRTVGHEDGYGPGHHRVRRRPTTTDTTGNDSRHEGRPPAAAEVAWLEMVVNWLRVTGVETSGLPRVRGALRQSRPGFVRSFIR